MDVMDVARLSTAMSSAKTSTEVSMKVYKMALDQMKDVGDLMTALSNGSTAPINLDPNVGQHLDISI